MSTEWWAGLGVLMFFSLLILAISVDIAQTKDLAKHCIDVGNVWVDGSCLLP